MSHKLGGKVKVAPSLSSVQLGRSARFIVAAFAAAALVVIAGVVSSTPAFAADVDQAVVVRVVDGDTLVVKLKGKQTRVRLLNVDTPETKDPNEPVECLGPEASQYLTRLLPKGAKVTLKYDDERFDRYGRTLAAVFTGDKKFVSEEIARRGLGMAVKFGDNTAFFKTVQAAQAQAKKKLRGLYSETVECAVPAQVAALQGQMAEVRRADSATAASADVSALVARSAAIVAGVNALEHLIDLDQPPISVAILLQTPNLEHARALRVFNRSVVLLRKELITVETALLTREGVAAQKVVADAAASAAAQAAAAQAAAAQAAAAQAADDAQAAADARAEADERAASVPAPVNAPPVPAPVNAPPPSGNVDKYTGCRAYGPNGTSVDDKGRLYTKISC